MSPRAPHLPCPRCTTSALSPSCRSATERLCLPAAWSPGLRVVVSHRCLWAPAPLSGKGRWVLQRGIPACQRIGCRGATVVPSQTDGGATRLVIWEGNEAPSHLDGLTLILSAAGGASRLIPSAMTAIDYRPHRACFGEDSNGTIMRFVAATSSAQRDSQTDAQPPPRPRSNAREAMDRGLSAVRLHRCSARLIRGPVLREQNAPARSARKGWSGEWAD